MGTGRTDHRPDAVESWSWWGSCAVITGLAGVAITQPMLDLFGRSPEFFVSGRYTPRQIVAFALIVAFVPPVVASVAIGIGRLLHASIGRALHVLVVFGLAALFALGTMSLAGVAALAPAVVVAVAVGVAVAWIERRVRPVRTFLSYLALGNLVFVALFLFASQTAPLIAGRTSAGAAAGLVDVPSPRGPVVFIIFDELPVTTLMRPDGTINDVRYPNFARLAGGSTWFRNASSRSSKTNESVPSILTGRLPDEDALPTAEDHPRNLFTLLGTRYPVNRYEVLTDMCPASVCEPLPPGELRQALRDGVVAYGHRVLPESARSRLPSLDHAWGGFGDGLGVDDEAQEDAEEATATDAESPRPGYEKWHNLTLQERSAPSQAAVVRGMAADLTAEPALYFAHVALPHYPWTLTPWGERLTAEPKLTKDPDDPAYDLATVQRYQLHAMQMGAADLVLGEVLDQLEATGAWDETLLVVTSDHGNSLLPPDFGRSLTERNREELLRIPLFIKAPGQAEGEVRDDVAQTIDILPSIIDLLGIDADWEIDGHSLYDGSEPVHDPLVDPGLDPALRIAARHAAQVGGEDWLGLAAVGEHADLVGQRIADLHIGRDSSLAWTPRDKDMLAALPAEGGKVPQYLIGAVTNPADAPPPELVVAVNGTVAGVAGTHYRNEDGTWRVAGFMGLRYRDGANDVVAYEVTRTAEGPVLHRVRDL